MKYLIKVELQSFGLISFSGRRNPTLCNNLDSSTLCKESRNIETSSETVVGKNQDLRKLTKVDYYISIDIYAPI